MVVAETWDKIYKAFENVSFVSYDFDSVKSALLTYMKLYHGENFNDYVESSQFIALLELFAYICEQLAFRIDLNAHESMLTTAERKASILKLAKLISYKVTRNIPLRTTLKITGISTSEQVYDSQGRNLTNVVVRWGDDTNSSWKEQFFTIMNQICETPFGQPQKTTTVGQVTYQIHELRNVTETDTRRTSFSNGVMAFRLPSQGIDLPFEMVPFDADASGVLERTPNPSAPFTIAYSYDGQGDRSPDTGWQVLIKQGQLKKLSYTFDQLIPNQVLDVDMDNVNDIDVWVQEVDGNGNILQTWEQVDPSMAQNVLFNINQGYKRYEVETLENDRVRLIFGDGDLGTIPSGSFNIWLRSSTSGSAILSPQQIKEQAFTFSYVSADGQLQSATVYATLQKVVQNGSDSDDIEHIRQAAPKVYQTQNRMVTAADYNSFMLSSPDIIKTAATNRSFTGMTMLASSSNIDNVKVFGDDLRIYHYLKSKTTSSSITSRSLINEVIEPLLGSDGVQNSIAMMFYSLTYPYNVAFIRPRSKLIERYDLFESGQPLREKSVIQGALDRHWYGEPDQVVLLGPDLTPNTSPKTPYAVVDTDTDKLIYDSGVQLVYTDSTGNYQLVNATPGNVSGLQTSISSQNRFAVRFDPIRVFGTSNLRINGGIQTLSTIVDNDNLNSAIDPDVMTPEVITIEMANDDGSFYVHGSVYGEYPMGKAGVAYTQVPGLEFTIGYSLAVVPAPICVGDAFIIDASTILTPQLSKVNLAGSFRLIEQGQLPTDLTAVGFNPLDQLGSWVLLVERIDGIGQQIIWNVTTRNLNIAVTSTSTKFWYSGSGVLVDPISKQPVYDQIKVLRSNVYGDLTTPIKTSISYRVIDLIRNENGETDINSLAITPAADDTGVINYQRHFKMMGITQSRWVYFTKDSTTGVLSPVSRTAYIESLPYTNNTSGNFVRFGGRDELDFMWQHFAGTERVIDPSISNVIDIFVLTRQYLIQMNRYIAGVDTNPPVLPSPSDLQFQFQNLLKSRMISDTIVLHPVKIKLLFGNIADPANQAKFKLIRKPGANMTTDQLRTAVLNIILDYFAIENWDLGQPFYATELFAKIHGELGQELASVVLTPQQSDSSFGDLFVITPEKHELLRPAISLSDIIAVDGFDRATLKQK